MKLTETSSEITIQSGGMTPSTVILRRDGNFSVTRTKFITRKQEHKEFPVNSITGVLHSAERPKGKTVVGIDLTLVDGNIIRLVTVNKDKFSISFNGFNLGSLFNQSLPLKTEAEQISHFLQVPLKTIDMSSILSAANTLKEVIPAIKNSENPQEVINNFMLSPDNKSVSESVITTQKEK